MFQEQCEERTNGILKKRESKKNILPSKITFMCTWKQVSLFVKIEIEQLITLQGLLLKRKMVFKGLRAAQGKLTPSLVLHPMNGCQFRHGPSIRWQGGTFHGVPRLHVSGHDDAIGSGVGFLFKSPNDGGYMHTACALLQCCPLSPDSLLSRCRCRLRVARPLSQYMEPQYPGDW